MLKCLSILGTTLLLLSSVVHANSDGDIIHSTSYIKGSIKPFYITFRVTTDGYDGLFGRGLEWFGKIVIPVMNDKPIDSIIWEYDKKNHTNNGRDDIEISPPSAIVMSDARHPYFTLEGTFSDQDGASAEDTICGFNPSYKIDQNDLNKIIVSDLIVNNKNHCQFTLLRFETM